jgi:FkbM family methyltransferase
MKKIIFDVGANDGSSCLHLQNENSKIFAFEPTPYLLNKYLYQYQNENYVVIDKAVSNFNGKAIFKIAGQHDWGCSSLNTFSDNLSETWKGRTDFLVTEEIEVDVITLEKFIIDNDINTIDWLHIDTQGSDLNVLKGLKDKISIVVAGVIEAPADESVKLYKEQPSKEESIDFLIKNGFKVNSMEYQMNEYNIYFSRS